MGFFDAIGDAIGGAVDFVGDAIGGAADAVGGFLGGAAEAVGGFLEQTGLGDIANSVMGFLGSPIGQALASLIPGAGPFVAGASKIFGMVNKISDLVGGGENY